MIEAFFIFVLVVLFVLAISDLVVGVSNDAVNFLNSAIGSKAAPFWIIMVIASLGIMVGATFSSGMMEVARKGIFHPGMFNFSEIMIIFLAVMLTDILLLDMFNTFGLPTSTTVSIVFELLGAAVAVALTKVLADEDGTKVVMDYINSGKALAIITGILLSVVVAFSVGAIVQFIARLLFTYNTERTYKYFGAFWGGLAISAITYFIIIKGAKGSSLIEKETMDYIKQHTFVIIAASFVVWGILLQLLTVLFKINIFKIIVLVGTFALAMAFAGNDLVNFIGVPLAGLRSWEEFNASGLINPEEFGMGGLAAKVATPTLYLLTAGIIMVLALWLSKKARSVAQTELNLARQDAGYERFGSTLFSRSLVRSFVNLGKHLESILPAPFLAWLKTRFDQDKAPVYTSPELVPAFDMVRASVNLTVASVLIAIGTSLKLPLSTTYVTFMVAMGTSMSDGAWGRESAVYRVTGVISVIGGWFLTAFAAFTAAFIIANFISFFSGIYRIIPIVIILSLAIYALLRTKRLHKEREEQRQKEIEAATAEDDVNIVETIRENVLSSLVTAKSVFKEAVDGLATENIKALKENEKTSFKLNDLSKGLKLKIHKTVDKLQEKDIESGHHYVQVIDYLRELSKGVVAISHEAFYHVDNNHPRLSDIQLDELKKIESDINLVLDNLISAIHNSEFAEPEELSKTRHALVEDIDCFRKAQLKRIKKKIDGTKSSLFYLSVLAESKNMVMDANNLQKAYANFEKYLHK